MQGLSAVDVCKLLQANGFEVEVAEVFLENKIDGSTLLDLNSEDLKELGITALGDRKRLQKLCTQTAKVSYKLKTSYLVPGFI